MKQIIKINLVIFFSLVLSNILSAQVRPDIFSFDEDQRLELANLIIDFVDSDILQLHCDYTDFMDVNSNEYDIHDDFNFLPFHRTYLERLEDWLLEHGHSEFVPLPKWTGLVPPPIEFRYAGGTGNDPGNGVSSACGSTSCDDFPGTCTAPSIANWETHIVSLPNYLTLPIVVGSNNDLCDWDMDPESYTTNNDNSGSTGISYKIEAPWHNSGHSGNFGSSVMGNFQSPAAAIFWLWHANVDDKWKEWECNCPDTGTLPFDLYMKDNEHVVEYYRDRGQEPNISEEEPSESPDIWVRKQNDGFTNHTHENAEYYNSGPSDYVYVQVRNRGCIDSPSTGNVLKLYWIKSTTGVTWPESFDGTIQTEDDLPLGGLIGSMVLPAIKPGGSDVFEFQWNPVNPADYPTVSWYQPKDFCLLARIESSDDPMTFPETNSHYDNTKNNNNIVWKNIVVLDNDPNLITEGKEDHYGLVYVTNPSTSDVVTEIIFSAEANPLLPTYAETNVTINDELWNLWKDGGSVFEGDMKTKVVDGDHVLTILTPTLILKNITLPSQVIYPVATEFNFYSKKLALLDAEYEFRIIQSKSNGKHIGAQLYIIKTGNRNSVVADAGNDREISLGESIDIAATDFGDIVEYKWYDLDGNLIYEGKDFTLSPEITKKYQLEVISLEDGVKDIDEIEIKIKEFEILNISPNPVVNHVTIDYKANNANSAYFIIMMPYGSSNNYIIDTNLNSTTIDMSTYQTGVYSVIMVCNGTITDTQTIIVQ